MRQTTLCLLLRDDEILLAMKKRGFGAGKWNGYGGKLEKGEDLVTCAVREVQEEIGVVVQPGDLQKVAVVNFYFKTHPEWDQEVSIFLAKKWSGEPVETEEMKPEWFNLEYIPYDEMWPDDRIWLPQVLAGKKVEGEFYFNDDNTGFERYLLSPLVQ